MYVPRRNRLHHRKLCWITAVCWRSRGTCLFLSQASRWRVYRLLKNSSSEIFLYIITVASILCVIYYHLFYNDIVKMFSHEEFCLISLQFLNHLFFSIKVLIEYKQFCLKIIFYSIKSDWTVPRERSRAIDILLDCGIVPIFSFFLLFLFRTCESIKQSVFKFGRFALL